MLRWSKWSSTIGENKVGTRELWSWFCHTDRGRLLLRRETSAMLDSVGIAYAVELRVCHER